MRIKPPDWTKEEIDFVKKHTSTTTNRDLARMINEKFHEGKKIRTRVSVMGLKFKYRIY